MLNNILRSTLNWFRGTPTPRIVNRFTGDTNTVDDLLSDCVISCLECMICVLAGSFIFNVFYLGFLLLASVMIFGYLLYFLRLYLSVSSSFYQISVVNKNKMCRILTSQIVNSVNLRALGKNLYLQPDFSHFCDYYQSAAAHLGKSG